MQDDSYNIAALASMLIIWVGIFVLIYRLNNRVKRLEKREK